MEQIEIGKVTTTHGIKGEIKILSDLTLPQKKEVFKIGSHLIIQHLSYTIATYRVHKGLDMITFKEFSNINDVLFMKGKKVYKAKKELHLAVEDILDHELMEYQVLTTTGKRGMIKAIETTGVQYKILRLIIDQKEVLLPYHQEFIEKIDPQEKIMVVRLI